jgi:hypothetical protein
MCMTLDLIFLGHQGKLSATVLDMQDFRGAGRLSSKDKELSEA